MPLPDLVVYGCCNLVILQMTVISHLMFTSDIREHWKVIRKLWAGPLLESMDKLFDGLVKGIRAGWKHACSISKLCSFFTDCPLQTSKEKLSIPFFKFEPIRTLSHIIFMEFHVGTTQSGCRYDLYIFHIRYQPMVLKSRSVKYNQSPTPCLSW